MTLEIKNIHVQVENKEILKGINLKLEPGKIYVLMGPNGSGKSTLANTIMGNPKFEIASGEIILDGEDITNLSVDKRAKKGLFLSFQYPSEVPGVTISTFLKTAYNSLHEKKISIIEFYDLLKDKLNLFNLDESFSKRYLNQGFSGGEKKKSEILQLAILNPKIAILDETDSGMDIDALKTISQGINKIISEDKSKTILIITHYKRILEYIRPDKIFVMANGKIVLEGGPSLVDELEDKGYGWIKEVHEIK